MKMKDVIHRLLLPVLLLLLSPVMARADIRLYIPDFTATVGDIITLELHLESDVAIRGFQADLTLPTGLALNGKTEQAFTPTERLSGTHALNVSLQDKGAIRILAYSLGNQSITGTSGSVLSIQVVATQSFEEERTITLSKIMVGGADGSKNTLEDTTTSVMVNKGEDDVVIEIPVAAISIRTSVMTLTPGQEAQITAFVFPVDATKTTLAWSSSDESVATVSDTGMVTALKDGTTMITASATDGSGKSATCMVIVATIPEADIELWVEDLQITQGETEEVALMLKNDVEISAFQVDMTLPAGLSIDTETGLTKTDLLTSAHQVNVQRLGEGKYRLMAYSANNATIAASEGEVITFRLSADESFIGAAIIRMENAKAGSASGLKKDLADVNVQVTGLRKVFMDIEPFTLMANKVTDVPLLLNNKMPITGFQADLYLPAGIRLGQESPDTGIEKSDRAAEDHSILATSQDEDSYYRIVAYSPSNSSFSGAEGTVASLSLYMETGISGSQVLQLKNIRMGASDGQKFDIPDLEITFECVIIGDANNNKNVNSDDVATVAKYILGLPVPNFNETGADANMDGRISVSDITTIVTMICK